MWFIKEGPQACCFLFRLFFVYILSVPEWPPIQFVLSTAISGNGPVKSLSPANKLNKTEVEEDNICFYCKSTQCVKVCIYCASELRPTT